MQLEDAVDGQLIPTLPTCRILTQVTVRNISTFTEKIYYPRTFEESCWGYCDRPCLSVHLSVTLSCDVNSSLSFYFVHFISIYYCHIVHVDAQ